MGAEETRAWRPLDPGGAATLLADVACRWWIAGGWALDLHVGRQTRHHDDIDVVVLREDLPTVQRHLHGWTLMAADPPGTLRDWRTGEQLPRTVHDVWCRPAGDDAWALQLMVVDPVAGEWVYPHDPRIRRPLATIGTTTPATPHPLPVLAPEIQLLHKSRRPRAKDEADFDAAQGHLSPARRAWLRDALRLTDPAHPWLALL